MKIETIRVTIGIEIRIVLCKIFKIKIIQSKDVKLKTCNSTYRIHHIYILVLTILCEHLIPLLNTVHVGSNNDSSCTLATWGKIYNFQNFNRISLSLYTTKIHAMGGFINAQPTHHALCLFNKGGTYEI